MEHANRSGLIVPTLVGAVLATGPLAAQETLRYTGSDEGTVTLESMQGIVDIEVDNYYEVTFDMQGDGTIVARYDSLVAYVGGAQGDQSPDVSGLLAGEYTLEFERPGVVVTLAYPEVDVGNAMGFDPLHSFDDFFVPLPDEDLAVGVEWSESFVHEGSSQPSGSYYSERTMTLRVGRDTVVAGVAAYVVSVDQVIMVETGGLVPGQGFDFVSLLEGEETGTAILSADGLLIHRSRSTELAGVFTVSAQGQSFDMPQTASFTGSADLIAETETQKNR